MINVYIKTVITMNMAKILFCTLFLSILGSCKKTSKLIEYQINVDKSDLYMTVKNETDSNYIFQQNKFLILMNSGNTDKALRDGVVSEIRYNNNDFILVKNSEKINSIVSLVDQNQCESFIIKLKSKQEITLRYKILNFSELVPGNYSITCFENCASLMPLKNLTDNYSIYKDSLAIPNKIKVK